jgi:hypothetical protein
LQYLFIQNLQKFTLRTTKSKKNFKKVWLFKNSGFINYS